MPTHGSRDTAVDAARGLAIVLIVVGHVVRGLSAGHQVDPSQPWYDELDVALYLVHLPVFVLLAGVFLPRGVRRLGPAAYLRARLTTLAWCFVLWTLLQGLVQMAAGTLANVPLSFSDVLVRLVAPLSQMWFLPTLAVLTAVTVLTRPWSSTGRAVTVLACAAVLSTLTWGVFGTWAGTQGMGLAIFFVVGAVCGDARLRRLVRTRFLPLVAAGSAVGLTVLLVLNDPTAPSYSATPRTAASVALGVLATALGLGATAGAARLVAASPLGGAVSYLGRHSLQIFLAHIVFASGSRAVLGRVVDDPWVLAVVGVVAGLGGPLLLVLAASRWRLEWLFAAPHGLSGTPATTA